MASLRDITKMKGGRAVNKSVARSSKDLNDKMYREAMSKIPGESSKVIKEDTDIPSVLRKKSSYSFSDKLFLLEHLR
jgi:hypothetical protein